MTTNDFQVPRGYRYDWALFSDWCAALEVKSLPADPLVVAEFLHDHPAADATQVRRVSAINHAHRRAGYVAPGTVPAVRAALHSHRRQRLDALRDMIAPVISDLPYTGWPGGVIGRRDGALLMFTALGYTPTAISRLVRGDIASDSSGVLRVAGTRHEADPDIGVPDACWRWLEVLDVLDRHLATHRLAEWIDTVDDKATQGGTVALDTRRVGAALFVPIDRWGHLPLTPTPLTPASIATLVSGHLAGTARSHRRNLPFRRPTLAPSEVDVEPDVPVLDHETYERGVRARRDAHTALATVADTLDEVEDRAAELLRRTLAILENTEL